jgi:hypothetical protein
MEKELQDFEILDRCLSVRQLARYWRVSPRKVRALIKRRIVDAIDLGGKRHELRITPEAVQKAQRRLAANPPIASPRCRQPEIDPEVSKLLEE